MFSHHISQKSFREIDLFMVFSYVLERERESIPRRIEEDERLGHYPWRERRRSSRERDELFYFLAPTKEREEIWWAFSGGGKKYVFFSTYAPKLLRVSHFCLLKLFVLS